MWLARDWKDFEVIDASGGEKLERWGEYFLIRPDPQVIWDTGRRHPGWKHCHGHYHRSEKGGGKWEFFGLPEEWSIRYKQFTFRLKPFSFKHTGLFPEQAVNWEWMAGQLDRAKQNRRAGQDRRTAQEAQTGQNGQSGQPLKILNLFAYTGGATLAAAAQGASVTHVDASRGILSWARENAASSGLEQAPIRWLTDDCAAFVQRELRRGNRYDGIVLDPPSYGRGPNGEVWKLEKDLYGLLKLCAELLSENAVFLLLNAYTTGLQPAALAYLVSSTVGKSLGGTVTADEIGLPVTESGLTLPCGASCRWEGTPLPD